MAPRYGKREDPLSSDISFDLERLFDPYNFDHIPYDDRLKLFKQRDLPHIKHYKAAVKIFGGPPRRTRAIEAPPMETPLKHRLGVYFNHTSPPPPPILNGSLKTLKEPVKEISKEEKARNEELVKTENYKNWIQKRQELRGNLNSIGLNEAILARKTDKSELEKRVEAKFRAERLRKPESPPPVEKIPSPKPPPDVPTMTVPPPDGLQILDKFLSLNRMRLIDLFRISDKDKSWSLSRTEFLNAVSQSEIPLSESEVDDLFITLDADLDDELNYQELNKGLMQWRKQRRDLKKQSLDEGKSGDGMGLKRPISSKGSKSKTKSLQSVSTHKTVSRERVDHSSSGEKSLPTSQSQTGMKSPEAKISRERSFQDQRNKSVESKENGNSEKPEFVKEKSQLSNAADQSFEDPSKSISAKELSFAQDEENAVEAGTHSRTISQHHVQISDSSEIPLARENLTTGQGMSTTLQSQEQTDTNVYEDVLFEASYTPRPADISQDISIVDGDGESEKPLSKTRMSTDTSGRRKAGSPSSPSKSRSSTPSSLEPPEFDTRKEARVPDSLEAMVDMRKHDRVVLSRNTARRNLSREQRVTFDELPGVIKVGYKAIDDHCSESTLGGENAFMVNQFRRATLKEYFEVKTLFDERGLPFNQKTMDRVLLYPGDKPSNVLKKNITIPGGPLTAENSPFNQPKPKKKVSKRRRGFAQRMRRMTGGQSLGGGGHSDDDRTGSGSSKRSFITVEDVYPFASTVAPKVYKENLSSGRALITRKVDSWMTFEEYCKYTEHIPTRFQHFNRHSDPDAAWPGSFLDKLRLCMPPYEEYYDGRGDPIGNRDSRAYQGLGTGLYNGKGSALFRSTAQSKRAYHGYNNDLQSWPIGDNGVMYGNIDEHRLVK